MKAAWASRFQRSRPGRTTRRCRRPPPPVARLRDDARRYARRHCQPSDIDDAVQEALLIIVRKLSALKAAAAFSGWLFTIVKREWDRTARAMFDHDNIEDAKVERYLAVRTDAELRRELSTALELLPAHYRWGF